MLRELKRVLDAKFGVPADLVEEFLSLIKHDAVLAQPCQLPAVEIQDRDDLPILSAGMSAGADVFVTGVREILDIGRLENMAILSPRQFWETLKAKPRGKGRRAKMHRSR